MNGLAIFNFKGSTVRTVMRGDEPWWVAKDVCEVLGLADGRTSIDRLDSDERHTMPVSDSMGREQPTYVINESGLYSLILRSRKKEAKDFKKWVTSEVLPSIRKTGSYLGPQSGLDRMADMMNQILPALSGKVLEVADRQAAMGDRLSLVEEKQKRVDPRAIEERMFTLHQLKKLLVEGTKGSVPAVNHPAYWRALKEHLKIASFQNRAALDVPMMDRAINFARSWLFSRGIQPPAVVETQESERAAV